MELSGNVSRDGGDSNPIFTWFLHGINVNIFFLYFLGMNIYKIPMTYGADDFGG